MRTAERGSFVHRNGEEQLRIVRALCQETRIEAPDGQRKHLVDWLYRTCYTVHPLGKVQVGYTTRAFRSPQWWEGGDPYEDREEWYLVFEMNGYLVSKWIFCRTKAEAKAQAQAWKAPLIGQAGTGYLF